MTETIAYPSHDSLTRSKDGDRRAFAELVKAQQRMVFSLAARMLNDRHEAEDLAQEVFLQLHRSLATLQTEAHLIFWLRRVTVNRAIDRIRQRQHHETDLSEVESLADEAGEEDPLLRRHLFALVAQLSESARAVVLLRYQEDLDPLEIAETLDMPINTVKSHLKRSLATLREQIEAEHE